jgi:hypothetical protein
MTLSSNYACKYTTFSQNSKHFGYDFSQNSWALALQFSQNSKNKGLAELSVESEN